jgi:regulator of sigma E protease
MLDFGMSIIAFIVAIGLLVAVHEFGHYWVARKLGFKVLRYSIGFGKPLARWRGRDPDRIEYWLSAIPLGGYVKLLDEREGPVPEAERHRAFNARPIPQRIAVLLAGPGFNFLFAIVAYWVMFVSGVPGIKPIVGTVEPGSLAGEAGLRADDEIVAVGSTPTDTWEGAVFAILDEMLGDGRIDLTVLRGDGREHEIELDIRGRESQLTEPDALFTGLGFQPGPSLPARISRVDPDSPAARAGLLADDRVLSVAERPSGDRVLGVGESPSDGAAASREAPAAVEITGWQQWRDFVRDRPGETVDVRVLRDGEELELPLEIGIVEDDGRSVGQIGAWSIDRLPDDVIARIRSEQRYGPLDAAVRGVQKTWEMSALTVRMLARMVVGDVSLRNVSGPISIAAYAGDSAAAGLTAFLNFLGIVSISLGIMNLLPVPLLDGGQIVYQIAELLKGAPLSERAMQFGQQLGIVFLIVLMSFVFYNDLARVFGQ